MTAETRKKREQQWKEKARLKHGDKYDYSESVYKGSEELIAIRCPVHGIFWQAAYVHIRNSRPGGCPECAKLSKDYDIESVRRIIELSGKWKLLSAEYKNNKQKLECECSKHGLFTTILSSVLQGKGCPKCGRESGALKNTITDEETRKLIKLLDTNDLVQLLDSEDYSGRKKMHQFMCPIHGVYETTVENLILGLKRGNNCCDPCQREKTRDRLLQNPSEVLKRMKETHGQYEYNMDTYVDMKTKMLMMCPVHGEFWQTPQSHINGHGCPKCQSSKMEKALMSYCDAHNILYISQWRPDWLGAQRCDLYLPEYNAVIECQGLQHFKPVKIWGGSTGFKKRLEADKRKLQLCTEHNVPVFYYTDTQYDMFLNYSVYHTFGELFDVIKC